MASQRRRQIGILSLSIIADDPRVRRQGDAFQAAGWDVIAFGLSKGARSPAPSWPIICCDMTDVQPRVSSTQDSDDSPGVCLASLDGNDSNHSRVNQVSLDERLKDTSGVMQASFGECAVNLPSVQPRVQPASSSRLRSVLKRLLPLWLRDIIRPYSSCASLMAKTREIVRICVFALPAVSSPIVSQWARPLLRAKSSLYSAAINAHHRLRNIVGLLLIRIRPSRAESAYWTLNGAFADLYRAAAPYRPSIWLANDWITLPLAQQLAQEQSVPFGYDTHELASSEYGHQVKWRILYKPLIIALESRGIERAAVVSCVSDGIAGHLQCLYRMPERPLVIRNMPNYDPHPFRATEGIRVLYHGVVAPGRGLEACIASVAQWNKGRSLSIRGPADDAYIAELRALIVRTGVGDRVVLLPPVPMVDLIREATAFDVGIFIFPSANQHNAYVLPNKIFEYVMAGLAVCVSALSDMEALVRFHDLGVLVEGTDPRMIAAAINSLDRARIDQFKRSALNVAKELNWEAESRRLVDAYNKVVIV